MTPSTSLALSALSPEVLAFAAEQGVAGYLPAVLDLLRRVYPNAHRYAITVEDDPEIANDRHIVLDVDVSLDVEQALAARQQWGEGLFERCPAPLVCVFRLSENLVP